MTDPQTLEQIQEAKAASEPVEATPEEVPTTPTQPVEDFEKVLAESQEIAETEYGFVKFADTVKT
jgi:hypothetical protein